MGCLGLGGVVVSLEPCWLQQGVRVGAEGVRVGADGVGAEEVFCGAINVQIKHELYQRGLCPCVFVHFPVPGDCCASSPSLRASPGIPSASDGLNSQTLRIIKVGKDS